MIKVISKKKLNDIHFLEYINIHILCKKNFQQENYQEYLNDLKQVYNTFLFVIKLCLMPMTIHWAVCLIVWKTCSFCKTFVHNSNECLNTLKELRIISEYVKEN